MILAEDELTTPDEDDLLNCVLNRDQADHKVRDPTHKYKGGAGKLLAVTMIQKCWRRFKAYTAYNQLRFLMAKATII